MSVTFPPPCEADMSVTCLRPCKAKGTGVRVAEASHCQLGQCPVPDPQRGIQKSVIVLNLQSPWIPETAEPHRWLIP
jgi:hypothetical protein